MKNKLFNGTLLYVWKAAWYFILAGLWGAFYETVFASNYDSKTETGTIIGAVFFIACGIYSIFVTAKAEK